MSSNGWEYVGKKTNKTKINNKINKKKPNEPSDHFESEGHIKVSETSFNAFLELEKRKEDKQKPIINKTAVDQSKENDTNDRKSIKPKKKKTVSPNESPKSNKPLNFETIAKELKVSDFEKVSEETKVKFPDMPLIWLKDIAYYLNEKFPPTEPEDVLFSDKSIEYPSSAIPKNVRDFIVRNIRQCPEPILQLIQEQLLSSLVKTSGPTMGFRIILQCISFEYPEFTLKNIQKFTQQRNSYNNRQSSCLSILWVASQSGKKDLKSGINVWLELMFPIIAMKAYSKFVIDSLRTLLELHSNSKLTEDVLDVKQFFLIFDFLFSLTNGLQPNSQKQLELLYHKIKMISIGHNRQNNSRLYFPSLLSRLNDNSSAEQIEEVLLELTNCLTFDNNCFSVWRSLYSQNLAQSAVLLGHLADNYQSLPSKLSKKLLRETVLSFRNTNDDSRAHDKTLKDGHEICEIHCETLLNAMSNWKFPFKSFLVMSSLLLITFMAYDTKSNGSFQKSFTGKLLKETGALPVVEHAFNKIEFYSMRAHSWISVNGPLYWKSISAVVSPYLTLFWDKFFEIMLYLWDSTLFIRVWINNNIPPILEKISDNYVPKLQSMLWQFSNQLQSHLTTVWAFILKTALLTSNWLQTNVLTGSLAPENLQKVAIQAIEVLQNYVFETYNWAANQMRAIVN